MIWTIGSKADVLKGEAKGVAIGPDGTIRPSPDLKEIFNTGEPFVWSDAVSADGTYYLGTGANGKIFRVDKGLGGKLFADLEELNVSALAVAADGSLYAGTSPDGKVYRIDNEGGTSVFFDPEDKYIWSLAAMPDGSLIIGTGDKGKIYRVKQAGEFPGDSLVFDSPDSHIISLAAGKAGEVYAGTDPGGVVLRINSDGSVYGVLDSPLREIHKIVTGVDGSVYALALGASSSAKPSTEKPKENESSNSTVTARKRPSAPAAARSRYDLAGTKSAVYRIRPDGSTDIIWNSPRVTAFSLYAHLTGNGVLIGTSDKGRIFSVRNDGKESLVLQTGEGQISSIRTYGNKLWASSSNQGKLFRFGGPSEKASFYESPVLKTVGGASWGTIWWRSSGDVSIQTRSGNTENPDNTWGKWSAAYKTPAGSKITSNGSRFLQWRAVLRSSDPEPRLYEVSVSYLPVNIAPEVTSIEVLPANVGLAPTPKVPVDPNIAATGLEPADFGIVVPPAVPRKLYQRGARSFIWKSEDRNGDTLSYSVFYREIGDDDFKLLARDIKATFFTADGLAFADGRYIFKIVASDTPSNPAPKGLEGELSTEPFDIDNTAPGVKAGAPTVAGSAAVFRFAASENSSYIQRAEYSVNGGKWSTVYPDDGIPDGQSESFTVTVLLKTRGEYAVTLRVFDAAGNIGNARAVVRY